ncbi:hypothetical protein [Mesorhizobium sp.]|uniref:hypothetical protein n=1 Tax=Mesorhizobium sp. TaxID=1871066 RepID=UPI000FE5BF51|nr:hypothetical protein [Mesorhizobium sp.]RWM18293.1 MAG: hypothetical protein EOR74_32950 [Mesorhizobium sp.]
MATNKFIAAAVLSQIALIQGCIGANRLEDRYGLDPSISPTDVKSVAVQQDLVLQYLAEDSLHIKYPLAGDQRYWYLITEAGFNYVDRKCDEYLYDTYVRSKESGRNKQILSAIGNLTNGILSVSDVSKATLSIVAQVFGFGAAINDAAAESYLLAIGPSAISGTVKKLRDAYREETLRDQEANNTIITSTAALGRIRGYMELCMPVFIEGKISDYVAKAGTSVVSPPAEEQLGDKGLNNTKNGSAASVNVELAPPI